MRLLVDASLAPRISARLAAAAYDAAHVAEHGLLGATDESIAAFAVANHCAIVSSGPEFATMLALNGRPSPSMVLMRTTALTPAQQANLLLANLPMLIEHLRRGSLIIIARGHLRVRTLPVAVRTTGSART
jgi:predicted nuclease of predicted toxin-antitoxin system